MFDYDLSLQANITKETNQRKDRKNISIKKNISNVTKQMKCWLFYFACVTLKDYFHKDSNYKKLMLLIG